MLGANCIYFKPTDSGGVRNYSDMKRGFWFFSCRGDCILTQKDEVKCELQIPKIISTSEAKGIFSVKKTKISTPIKTPAPVKKSSETHKHNPKKHIHKKEK